ncbi:MAG: hypothetical protein WCG34_12560 [Leptolinea sp.]
MPQKNFDGVIESVRYTPSGMIDMVRMYEKRGPSFSDLILLSRDQLLQKLRTGKIFAIGRRIPNLASTFEISMPIIIAGPTGKEVIITGQHHNDNDDIQGAPLF